MVEGKEGIQEIISRSAARGWVLEPDAERILLLAGLSIPRFRVALTHTEAQDAAQEIGYPVVAKVVSPDVLHKSEVHGVEVGIDNDEELIETFDRLCFHTGIYRDDRRRNGHRAGAHPRGTDRLPVRPDDPAGHRRHECRDLSGCQPEDGPA